MARLVVIGLFVIAVLHSGAALRCYVCEGDRSSDCGTMFWGSLTGNKYLQECNAILSVTGARCQKMITGNTVTRSCAANVLNPCDIAGGAFEYCGICETDACNGSTKLASVSGLTLLSLLGAALFFNTLHS